MRVSTLLSVKGTWSWNLYSDSPGFDTGDTAEYPGTFAISVVLAEAMEGTCLLPARALGLQVHLSIYIYAWKCLHMLK